MPLKIPRLKYQLSDAASLNALTYEDLFRRLCSVAVNTYQWINLPPEINERFLELSLFATGTAIFYWEDIAERYVALTCSYSGPLDVYNIPKRRMAYATNGYNCFLDDTNSVLMFNNYARQSDFPTLEMFAWRMTNALRTMDVNLNAQKTPVLILTDQQQLLSLKQVYNQFQGNQPAIFGSKALDPNSFKVLETNAPFVADKIFDMYLRLWEDALNFLGIETVNRVKSERLITDEVRANLGYAHAQRYVRLNARQLACREINRMFGLNIDVRFRPDLAQVVHEAAPELEVDPLE